jgi:hypothetical protein
LPVKVMRDGLLRILSRQLELLTQGAKLQKILLAADQVG